MVSLIFGRYHPKLGRNAITSLIESARCGVFSPSLKLSTASSSLNNVRSTASSGSKVYESKRAVNEYLLSHYGHPDDIMPYKFGPIEALNLTARSAALCQRVSKMRLTTEVKRDGKRRALDVGCAVGGSTFELSRHFDEVVGIDYSKHFVDAAKEMQLTGEMEFDMMKQGKVFTRTRTYLASDIDRSKVCFLEGDACSLDINLGKFDLILGSNLLCRLPSPTKFLDSVPKFLVDGGTLVLISPYSWLEEYTLENNWIGAKSEKLDSFTALESLLSNKGFKLIHREDVSFIIREHERKFQYGVSDCTVWRL